MASRQPISSPTRAISGTTPEVERVIRRRRERDALAVHGDLHRVAHRVEVVERLAHAHQHEVGDQPLLVRLAAPVAEVVAGDHDLADDLGGGQVAHQPLGAGVAEGAGQRAADLAMETQSVPRSVSGM